MTSALRYKSNVKPRLVLIAGILLMASGCGGGPTSPTSRSASGTATGIVEGVVYHDTYLVGRIALREGPQPNARVVVTQGPAAGATFLTGADGAYRFALPTGPFRLQWSAEGFETRESETGSVRAGETTEMGLVTLRLLAKVPIAEWTITGTVVDGQGNPVAGASLLSAISVTSYAAGQTDATGQFRLTSTRQHPDTLPFTIEKSGYETAYMSVPCVASCATTLNARLRRIVRQYLDGPTSMRVGDLAPVDHVREYDEGSVDRWRPFVLQSSDASVLQVQEMTAPYEHVFVKAIGPGVAVLTYPDDSPLRVTVFP